MLNRCIIYGKFCVQIHDRNEKNYFFFSYFSFCFIRFNFLISQAFLETKWSVHINLVIAKERINTVFDHGCHLWVGNLCCVDVVKRAVSVSRYSENIMAVLGVVDSLLRGLFVYLIKGYRIFLSPVIGKQCRFHPTCSQYALDALNKKSFFTSIKLIILRLAKCHPWHEGGFDPVK